MNAESLTVAKLEDWLAQFPQASLVHANEGEIVVVTGDEKTMVIHPIATPV